MTTTRMQPLSAQAAPMPAALCVDMDGTLVSTDLLWESVMALVRHQPLEALWMPLWLLKGKANLKARLADRFIPNPATLPYRKEVLDFLVEQKEAGRSLILATASDQRVAQAVADHLGIFDRVLGSDGERNLSSSHKLDAIRTCLGDGKFCYVGDSTADLVLWQNAEQSYLVAPSRSVRRRAAAFCTPARVFEDERSQAKALLKVMRPKQWVKNLLLFVPLLTAHQISHLGSVAMALLAFVAFSLCASSVYILNDLLDLEADRQHPTKSRRPFAAGTLKIPHGVVAMFGLLAVSFVASATLIGSSFTLMLAIYLGLTTAYSLYLKKKLLLDVITLAGLYTHRIVAGGAATHVVISPWLLAFSMFMFLSLAFIKRYSELRMLQDRDETAAKGRCYVVADLAMIESCGPAAGYMAVLVFCLYINSPQAGGLYKHVQYLWAVCPILLYWITRIWFMARRRELTDDPIAFALRDRVSWMAGAVGAGIMLAATL